MIILATADFHGNVEAFRRAAAKAKKKNADVIVVCGDITHFGSLEEAESLLSYLRNLQSEVLFVPGNCDPPSLSDETDVARSIHGVCLELDKVSFLGVGGSSPSPFSTPFELSEAQITEILEKTCDTCPNKQNILLVSHSPPKDTKLDVAFMGGHVGSSAVRAFIERVQPRLVLCGHIHEAIGVDKIDDSVVVNPGSANHGRCAIIELNKKVKMNLDRL